MKKVALFGSVLALAVAMTGCKSDFEKYADAVCECKDKKCADDLEKAMKEKYKDKKPEEMLKSMTEKDLEAAKRGSECEAKLK